MSAAADTCRIAVVGLACRYPGARSPRELWENALAGRRAFRRIPSERLRLEDYRGGGPDSVYVREAAVIEDWEFDRVAFRVAGSTYRAADAAHWLALEVAASALADAGLEGGEGLPREATGVLVGNSLTGETSRAQQMRLRWPYVRRMVGAALAAEGWSDDRLGRFLAELEERYKAPFPEPGDETLAGGLANTIAGRIANHFDLGGGGYSVDGACASSLLALANACSALVAGDLEVALAGGVDLSLDPFELVGFSRAGAFARDRMRVFDARSAGFLPGEGCGFAVLMPLARARGAGLRVHAVIRGWGISSDGAGGLTRPDSDGQLLALDRAYRRAGFGPESVAFFEGHGTGTAVGDAAELATLVRARRAAGATAAAAVGSVKAIVGHTKAAAGLAGTIKAVAALEAEVLPPTVGCEEPHPMLREEGGSQPVLRTLSRAEAWPAGAPLRASVSAMGFGGINVHLTLEGALEGIRARPRRRLLSSEVRRLDATRQDAEILLLAAADAPALAAAAGALATEVAGLSAAELTDLAAHLASAPGSGPAPTPTRGAVVAATPAGAAARLRELARTAEEGAAGGLRIAPRIDPAAGVFFAVAARPPALGLLLPGQGSPPRAGGGEWVRRFEEVEALYELARLDSIGGGGDGGGDGGDGVATERVQPAIATATAAALGLLERLGLEARVAVGHSLGELAALHWAGCFDAHTLIELARARGEAMAAIAGEAGGMVSLRASSERVVPLIAGLEVSLAGENGPDHCVVSGPLAALSEVEHRARALGVATTRLRVSHAFHSPAMAPAAGALSRTLAEARERGELGSPAPGRRVVSTVTGELLEPGCDLEPLLVRQLTEPVRFARALRRAEEAAGIDLWIEAGPGRVLCGLAAACGAAPAVSVDAAGPGVAGLLAVAGAAFALGAPLAGAELFRDRLVRRPVWRERPRTFLANPCEQAPAPVAPPEETAGPEAAPADPTQLALRDEPPGDLPAVELVRRLVASRVELPESAVRGESRMLSDLHLSSIAVGQLVVEAARRLGAGAPASPTDFADASVAEMASALEELVAAGAGGSEPERRLPAGVDTWVRAFVVERIERPRARRSSAAGPPALAGLFATEGDVLAAALGEALPEAAAPDAEGARAVVVCLPSEPSEPFGPAGAAGAAGADGARWDGALDALLAGARAALADREAAFVLVHRGFGAGFARSLHLERPGGTTVVVEVPAAGGSPPGGVGSLVEAVLAELSSVSPGSYSEAVYDPSGARRVPVLRRLDGEAGRAGEAPAGEAAEFPLGAGDVLLVTGGGRGIAAECALALARETGAALALVGRSRPADSAELAANLERIRAAGIRCAYRSADVTDPGAVSAAVAGIVAELGPVTGVLHGAGANQPRLIAALDAAAVAATLAPKVGGLRHVLQAVEASGSNGGLKLLVGFGSIIARTGMAGEADYALANELLTREVERYGAAHPGCRALAAEWSVWSGIGMGARLGKLDALVREGITPIPPDRGLESLLELLRRPRAATPAAVVVAGRFGEPPTVDLDRLALPFLRFLERERFSVPGVELIVEADLGADSDPYLSDHVYSGERLFPAVLGLEAMAQVAGALARSSPDSASVPTFEPVFEPIFERVRFDRPVSVPEGERVTLRLAALVRGPGQVEVVLRSSATGFQLDHFRALCRFDRRPEASQVEAPAAAERGAGVPLTLDPARDLYGGLLFHRGRFRRLRAYRRLRATECAAEISPDGTAAWFGRTLPGALLLGDPAVRDAAIHAIQACIPQATVLPVGVERLEVGVLDAGRAHTVRARERSRDGRTLVYDLELVDEEGRRVERWTGLTLRAVDDRPAPVEWAPDLLGPYLERRLAELVPGSALAVVLGRHEVRPAGNGGRRRASDRVLAEALGVGRVGASAALGRRPDGRPDGAAGRVATASHFDGWVLAVSGPGPVGCDVEPVAGRDERDWRDLLGPERSALAELLAGETGEDRDLAGTRVWTAVETLKKAGLPPDAPLVFERREEGGWLILRSGRLALTSLVTRAQGVEAPLALAFLGGASPEIVPGAPGAPGGRGGGGAAP